MLINQNIFSEYLTIWNQYEYGHKNREILLTELKARFPLDDKPFRLYTWTIPETTFIYYGLNSKELLSVLDSYAINPLLHAIDSENIQELFLNHLGHGICPGRDCVVVSKFVSFLQEKNVPIPLHLLPRNNESNDENETLNENETSSSKKRVRKESYRIEIMRNAAALRWVNEKNENKEYTSPTMLARSKDMNNLVDLINKIGGLKPIQGDEYSESSVDPEWFSDLFPGDKKPGPKPRN